MSDRSDVEEELKRSQNITTNTSLLAYDQNENVSTIVPESANRITTDLSANGAVNVEEPNHAYLLSPWQEKFIIILLVICNFLIANGVSLQGPFFPKEAESKGCTPITYSSIFAIYELIMLFTSFIFGNIVDKFKPNVMSGLGLTVTGLSTALFGLLTHFNQQLYFVLSAFSLRIIESLGATAFATSSYSFISTCFPKQTATMFATLETAFGGGVVIGPVIGGFLYDIGGFLLPFAFIGVLMTTCGIIILSHPVQRLFLKCKENGERMSSKSAKEEDANVSSVGRKLLSDDLSDEVNSQCESINDSSTLPLPETTNLRRFLSSPVILIDSLIIISALNLMGFNGATLEAFLRHSGNIVSSTLAVSLLFAVLGGSYGISAFLCGKACDRLNPKYLLLFSIAGSALTTAGLIFIGPLPFLEESLAPSLTSTAFCLILFGIGTATKQVAAYTHALKYTIQKKKFPPNQQTYGYLSGLYFACLSLGGSFGALIGGSAVQQLSFQYATLVMWVIELVIMSILLCLHCCCPSFRL